jgi:hypothetical protein
MPRSGTVSVFLRRSFHDQPEFLAPEDRLLLEPRREDSQIGFTGSDGSNARRCQGSIFRDISGRKGKKGSSCDVPDRRRTTNPQYNGSREIRDQIQFLFFRESWHFIDLKHCYGYKDQQGLKKPNLVQHYKKQQNVPIYVSEFEAGFHA